MIIGHGDDAYKYGEIKANFSSNVYYGADNDKLKEYISERISNIGHYPEPQPFSLEKELSERIDISEKQISVTNGATEAIYLLAHIFKGENTLIHTPAFQEYEDACLLYGHKVEKTETLPFNKSLDMQKNGNFRILWICEPANPTGRLLYTKDEWRKIFSLYPETIFILDHSYEAFSDTPILSAKEALQYPNVILIHSATKRYAIPGLRLGYITANENIINTLRNIRMPWSVNSLAIEAGLFIVREEWHKDFRKDELLKETKWIRSEINKIENLNAEPTNAHFFIVELKGMDVGILKEHLAKNKGILIRDARNFYAKRDNKFRIATMSHKENLMLLTALKESCLTVKID